MAQFNIRGLLSPAAFAHPVERMQVIETHISWVVLTGQYAYKIKKELHYEFLDASTLELRRALCHEELRLNRRLAPKLYLDVVAIVQDGDSLRVGGAGSAVEYAVRMRQFDPEQELSRQLAAGTVTVNDMRSIANEIAAFHRHATPAAPDWPYGSAASVEEQIVENLTVLERHVAAGDELTALDSISGWLKDSLARLAPLIAARKRTGSVRECHGDLHCRNIVHWRGQWVPFDCIEFNADLRFIDVMNDVAFLYMDLAAHERRDLAHALLSSYLEATGDYPGLPLLDTYAVYRALVRAKIDALAATSAVTDSAAGLCARRALRIQAAAGLAAARQPALLITHGLTGCGKSWLSELLVPALPAVRIRSDLERKRIAGLQALADSGSGVGEKLYSEAATNRVQARLADCASAALAGGFTVLVDAAFLRARHREHFRQLARERQCPFVILSCHADDHTLRHRVRARTRAGSDPSEATIEVLDHQLATREPLSATELGWTITIDTGGRRSAESCIADVRARLARRGSGRQ